MHVRERERESEREIDTDRQRERERERERERALLGTMCMMLVIGKIITISCQSISFAGNMSDTA